MNNKAIGIFDSGVGGLSCVKEVLHCLPGEDIIYLGDTLRMPYGVKTIPQLNQIAKDNVNFLQKRDVKLIAAACGTVSSNVPKENIENLHVPFVDVINPTVTAALKASRTNRIGVIATPATVKANSIGIRLEKAGAEVISVGCTDFVPLIESGHIDDDLIKQSALGYLKQIKDFKVDTLILGCTHYPIIAKTIQEIMGEDVVLIDSGRQTALEIKAVLEKLDMLSEKKENGKDTFYVTDNPDGFDTIAGIFLGKDRHIKSILKEIDK